MAEHRCNIYTRTAPETVKAEFDPEDVVSVLRELKETVCSKNWRALGHALMVAAETEGHR